MNREIKFRAKVNGSYVYSDSYVNLAFYFDATKSYEQEQFTGLKDKNGKEIYEGDVMKDRFGAICQIVYVDDFGGYRQLSKIGYSPLSQSEIISSNDIVIGNLYENPELL